MHEHTVGKWRRRFVRDRIEELTDEYRPGRPRGASDDQRAEEIERTLNTTPRDATHWSIRSIAAATGLSHTTIRRIWTAFGLQPHRSETFKLSTDPLFVDKVRDIVDLYMAPPNRVIVLCVDEKSQIQALDREQPMTPGIAELRVHSYNPADHQANDPGGQEEDEPESYEALLAGLTLPSPSAIPRASDDIPVRVRRRPPPPQD